MQYIYYDYFLEKQVLSQGIYTIYEIDFIRLLIK